MSRGLVPVLVCGALLSACAGSRASAPANAAYGAPSAGAGQTASQDGAQRGEASAARATPAPTPAPHSPGGRRPEGPLAEGVEAFRAGRWPQAADAFRAALSRDPEDVDAQFNLALTEERLGSPDRARSAYQAALKLDADHLPSLVNLARLERQTGRAERAAQLLETASRRPSLASEPGLWVQLSVTERAAGNLADAEQAARHALSLRRDPGAYEALALVASARGQDHEAELLATSALRLDEARASTHVTLGLVAYRLGEVGRARAEFDRAAALDPGSADAWANLGALALGWRDYAGAERAYRRASGLEPWAVDSRLHFAEALAAQAAEDPAKATAAATAFREVLARAPDRPEAICGAGWALAQDRGAATEAGKLLRRCRELPDTPAAERRRIDGRLSVLESLARGGPASPSAGPEPASSQSSSRGAREQVGGVGGSR